VLTGHLLKDADAIMKSAAGRSIEIDATIPRAPCDLLSE